MASIHESEELKASHAKHVVLTRARGTELISPEDLIDSTKLLAAQGLGMRCRTFKSGVVVVEAGEAQGGKL